MTDARITQVSLEVTYDADPDLRVTQTAADAVFDANPALRVTQTAADAVYDANPALRITQAAAEAVYDADPDLRVTQAVLEVVWAPRIIRTPPTADLSGAGYADLLLHTLFVIDGVGDQVVTGGDTVVDAALDTVIDLAGDLLEGADNLVVATPYWT